MGCNNCRSTSEKEKSIIKRIMDYVDRDDYSRLDHLIRILALEEKLDSETVLNKAIIPLNNCFVNILGYSLWLGKAEVYSYLITKQQASVKIMDEIFTSVNISALGIICEKGYVSILKLYLPDYLSFVTEYKPKNEKSSTISFSNSRQYIDSNTSTHTPIQQACINGHINVIHFLNEYFSVLYPPFPLDVHSIDEITGENCALLSVRTGNFVMMKLLYEGAKADFHIKNNNNEGALQILAAATKNNCALQFLECVMYLVEVVKVDITYMHEETLLLLENKIIIKYIEEKLRNIGVLATKKDLEILYRIKMYRRVENLEEKSNVVGDTQEISAIAPGSCGSNFTVSLKF